MHNVDFIQKVSSKMRGQEKKNLELRKKKKKKRGGSETKDIVFFCD